MNIVKNNRLLVVACLLSASVAIASEEAPSSPSRTRRYPDSVCVTPPRAQRQRVMPNAPRAVRVLNFNTSQDVVDQIENMFDTPHWVERYPRNAACLISAFEQFTNQDPRVFGLKASDGRSVLYMASQHPELSYNCQWLWGRLPGNIKQQEVYFQPGLNRFGFSKWNSNTLLHNFTINKDLPMTHNVFGQSQDLLRKNVEGKLAFECYSGRQSNRIDLLTTATLAQAGAYMKKAQMGLVSGHLLR